MWTKQTKLLQITALSEGITILNKRIILKDDIEFVAEFPCLLGHPVLWLIVEINPSVELRVEIKLCIRVESRD